MVPGHQFSKCAIAHYAALCCHTCNGDTRWSFGNTHAQTHTRTGNAFVSPTLHAERNRHTMAIVGCADMSLLFATRLITSPPESLLEIGTHIVKMCECWEIKETTGLRIAPHTRLQGCKERSQNHCNGAVPLTTRTCRLPQSSSRLQLTPSGSACACRQFLQR